jgi:hypothetical protein
MVPLAARGCSQFKNELKVVAGVPLTPHEVQRPWNSS